MVKTVIAIFVVAALSLGAYCYNVDRRIASLEKNVGTVLGNLCEVATEKRLTQRQSIRFVTEGVRKAGITYPLRIKLSGGSQEISEYSNPLPNDLYLHSQVTFAIVLPRGNRMYSRGPVADMFFRDGHAVDWTVSHGD